MIDIALVSYSSAAALFAVLTVLLSVSRSARGLSTWLIVASAVSTAWATFLVFESRNLFTAETHALWYGVETLRYAAWLGLMAALLYSGPGPLGISLRSWLVHGSWLAVLIAGLAAEAIWPGEMFGAGSSAALIQIGGLLALSLIGVLLVEQLVRNTRAELGYSFKHLYIGLAALFAFDLLVFAVAFLFRAPNPMLWNVRGAANALIVPLLALSASRNPQWSARPFVSRHVVFYTSSLVIAGGFLMLVSAGGYYVRLYGGSWGEFAQLTIAFAALLLIAVVAASAKLRAELRVFLTKHFYRNRYDYREEWLKFMERLGRGAAPDVARDSVIKAIGGIVESPGGLLFERSGAGYSCVAAKGVARLDAEPSRDDPVVQTMADRGWIVDVEQLRAQPQGNPDLRPPPWLAKVTEAWLIVPLMLDEELVGWVVLLRSATSNDLNWEDWDLLKTTGRAAALHLALMQTSEALSEARQFEAFNRLSAFVVHDIKNVIAQLTLVVSNANRHIANPEFMKDAVATIDNAVGRMNRLIAQLRKAQVPESVSLRIELDRVAGAVVERSKQRRPVPELRLDARGIGIVTDPERLQSVIAHLVQNAQEATPEDGRIVLSVACNGGWAILVVEDNGCGMDEDFVRERLFKPFDTTKGNAGMGIGVYEAREFIRAAGGEVRVSSARGRGTRFELSLPLADAERGASNVATTQRTSE